MKRTTELTWAGIFVAVALLWMVLERVAGLHGPRIEYHAMLTNLFALPAVMVYVLALRDKRDSDLGGTMTYSQGFVSGAIITVIVALVSPLSQWVTHTIITPKYFENAIAAADRMGMASRDEAEAYFNLANYIRLSMFGALAMGLGTTAVVAFFVKRKPSA